MWSKRNTSPLLVGMQIGTTTMESSMANPQKIGNHSSYRPSHTTPGHIPKECPVIPQGHMLNYVHSSIICNSQNLEKTRCPSTEEWIRKMWFIYTMEYYTAEKNNDIMKFAGKWMALENVILNLFVRVSNQVAVNMYKQLGYSIYRTVIEYYSASNGEPDEDAYDMRKALSRDTEKKSIIPLPSPHSSDIATFAMRTHLHEPGKQKKTVVLRDHNLTGLAEDKTLLSTVNNPSVCSDPQTSPEMKPHSYLHVIRSGLDDLEASGSYSSEQQLCPYAAAGECQFVDACVYLHGDV
ncbi:hypothetical protein STEG23_026115 [Scotinomys teguina]